MQCVERNIADEHTVAASHIPFGKEKVITCYGVIGILSLATSTSYCSSDTIAPLLMSCFQ